MAKKKLGLKPENIADIIMKVFFFLAFPAAWSAGFSGIKYMCETIHAGKPLEFTSFLAVFTVLICFTMVFGRFFCSRACIFGTYGDVLYYLAGRKKLIPKQAQDRLKYLKYIMLAAVLALCVLGYSSVISAGSPWTFFSHLVALKPSVSGKAEVIGLVLFLLCSAGMVLEERFFCRFLCPFGAVFSLLPVLPFSMIGRKRSECLKGCRACSNVCPAKLDLPYKGEADPEESAFQFRMGECFECSKCARICPKDNAGCATVRNGTAGILMDIAKAVILAALLYLITH